MSILRYINHDWDPPETKTTASRLLMLKNQLEAVPDKNAENLLIASFNIREFGNGAKYGARLDESILYLAEIINRFDVVAVQEVRSELGDLWRLMRYLGLEYEYLLSDITVGAPGNQERMAFLYDSRRVKFGGFAGQVVLPPLPSEKKKGPRQPARAPFMVGFQAGWTRFVLASVHMFYGDEKPDNPQRVAEIDAVAKYMSARAKDANAWAENVILLGDFNIFDTDNKTYKALTAHGFEIPKELVGVPTDIKGTRPYDQIAFRSQLFSKQLGRSKGGAIALYDKLFTDADEASYVAAMGEKYTAKATESARTNHYRQWRTFQLSDHRPLWVELKVDFSRGFLANRMNGKPLRPNVSEEARAEK